MSANNRTSAFVAVILLPVCALIQGSVFISPSYGADHIYHDTIIGPDDSYDYLYVHDSPPDHTHVRMIGGYVYDLFSLDASRITITGGRIVDLYAKNSSTLHIAGGLISDLMSYDTSTVEVAGGQIPGGLQCEHNSTVNITGGVIGSWIYGTDSGVVNIRGGQFTGYLVANTSCVVNIFGRNLQFDPDAVIPSPWGPDTWPGGRITGQYADGSPLDVNLVDNIGGTGSNNTFAHIVLHDLHTVYVDDDAPAPGDGRSWQTAYKYLQDALMMASPGAEIRVAQGLQKPDLFVLSDRPVRGRYETFQLSRGVAIRGGYAGTGAVDPNARDIRTFETLLTGDLLLNDPPYPTDEWEDIRAYLEHPDRNDNCYSVVTADGVDVTCVLDGCTITAGHSNIYGEYGPWTPGSDEPDPYSPENTGGGLYNNSGSPLITNCTFRHNSAIAYRPDTGGGAIFNLNAAPTITDCNFIENWTFSGDASCSGGAIRNIDSDTTLTACTFTANSAQGFDSEYYGGAVFSSGGSLTLTDCTFTDNHADWGGAINNHGTLTLTGCHFSHNHVNDNGGAIINQGPLSMTDCTFTNNQAYSYGGALCSGAIEPMQITACTFTANTARDGGALWSDFRGRLTIQDSAFTANTAEAGGALNNSGAWYYEPGSHFVAGGCTFTANTAIYGGAVYNDSYRQVTFMDCLFNANSASRGAAAYNAEATSTWTGCTFTANTAVTGHHPSGGGIYNYSGNHLLTNCLFAGNRSVPDYSDVCSGGGLYDLWCRTQLTHCTFADNSAKWGPDVYVDEAHTDISHCIMTSTDNPLYDYDGFITLTWSNVRSDWTGEGNIDIDPLFVSSGQWDSNGTPDDPNDDMWFPGDYHLKSQAGHYDAQTKQWITDNVTSPSIDAGDPLAPIGFEPFPNGGQVNMGVYGGTTEASKSYFGGSPCETMIAGDINGDCKVDFTDMAIMLLHWLNDSNP